MKAKITVTVTRIVDLDDPYYKGETYPERLAEEIACAEELGIEWLCFDSAQWQTTGELIEDGEGTES